MNTIIHHFRNVLPLRQKYDMGGGIFTHYLFVYQYNI